MVTRRRTGQSRSWQRERQSRYVFRIDREFVGGELGVDVRPLPMLLQAVHRQPGIAVIAEGVRREPHLGRRRVAALFHDGVDFLRQLLLGFRLVGVLGVRADEVRERQPLALGGGNHHVGGLLLRVVGAAVGHGRAVEQVAGVVGGVVHVIELLFVPRRLDGLVLEDLEEVGGFAEAGPRRGGAPDARVVDGEVPAGRPAHREAADHHAVVVDGVVLLDAVHRLERIDFAGEFVGAAVAAVEAQDEGAGRRELGVRFLAAVDEIQFGQVLAAAVAPEIETVLFGRARLERRRDDQPVGLDGAVDARDVAAPTSPVAVVQGALPSRSASARS